jgi:hypothetical protein
MDSRYAADGKVDMRDEGKFTKITVPPLQGITNSRAANGETEMKARPFR